MPAFDSGFKIAARVSGQLMAHVAIRPVDEWRPVVSEVQTAERFADRAFRARRGSERFVVYFEAYTYWRRESPWNLLAKSGLLSERERLPTVQDSCPNASGCQPSAWCSSSGHGDTGTSRAALS